MSERTRAPRAPAAEHDDRGFASRLLGWFDRHGRHDLPWQHDITPYRVWISEIMLQQTQVTTVIPYYRRFMASFPQVASLAAAADDEVLHHWSGLGYYARARNLHRAARQIVSVHDGQCPRSLDDWLALPGIGRSTAGAILSIACGQRHPILDGNVKRVLTRYHGVDGWPGKKAVEDELWALADRHTPQARVAQYSQAIMDLGATLCTRRKPDCAACPQRRGCRALADGTQHELPARKPKQDKPVRTQRMLVLTDADGAVLLMRRPPTGIWGGLWSLPELGDDDCPQAWTEQRFHGAPSEVREWPGLRHTFSHFHLDITPLQVKIDAPQPRAVEDGSWVWYNRNAPPAVGVAAPILKLLRGQTT